MKSKPVHIYRTGGLLQRLPISGHRMDIDIIVPRALSRARCECGWLGTPRSTARAAADEWRDHVGIVA